MTDPDLPWLYPYQEDGPRLDSIVQRPIVSVTIIGTDTAPTVFALVDSGREHNLVAPWVARTAGLPSKSDREIDLGLGGEAIRVSLVPARLRLQAPDGDDSHFIEWEAEVGIVSHWKPTWPALMGQVGFFDRFTVSMHRGALTLAIEGPEAFDRRHPWTPAAAVDDRPRPGRKIGR